jgi:hypothetical protein
MLEREQTARLWRKVPRVRVLAVAAAVARGREGVDQGDRGEHGLLRAPQPLGERLTGRGPDCSDHLQSGLFRSPASRLFG